MGEGRIPNSPAVMSKREKRKSERKSINDCRTEFRITRNVSDPEIEGKQSSRDQVSELSEHEKLYNFKKSLKLAKSSIENRIYRQKTGNAIRAARELQTKILLDAANIVFEESCATGYN